VLYVSRRYPPSVGGMQRLARELHLALSARTPVRAALWGGGQALLPLFALAAFLRAAAWLALRPRAGEVVLAGDALLAPLGLLLGRLFGRPVVAIAHGLDVTYPHPLHRLLVPPALRRLDAVIAISERTRELVLAQGVAPERCAVVRPGIGEDPLPARATARRRLGERLGLELGDRPVLATVCRLVPRKGVRWFVGEVMPLLSARRPDVLYVHLGDGPDRPADAEGVRMLGQAPDDVRDDLYAAADLLVMPYRSVVGDAEGFGLVAAEAMRAGLPVVATAVDAVPEVVRDGVGGRVVPPEEPTALADAIVALLDDPTERTRLSASARADAEARFGWAKVGDDYLAAIARAGERTAVAARSPGRSGR
jgi:phosphatidylinositol alpha-1,6-mannosyltransferase